MHSYEEIGEELSATPGGAGHIDVQTAAPLRDADYVAFTTEQQLGSTTRQTSVAGTVTYEASQPSTQFGQ